MIIFLIILLIVSAGGLTGGTFESALREALSAFERGDWVEAHGRMQAFESVFGEEPEFKEEGLRRGWLPRRGWAALAAGDTAQALLAFGAWLESYSTPVQVLRLVSYGYAETLEQQGELESAIEAWRKYESSERQRPAMAEMARLRTADLKKSLGRTGEALTLVADLHASAVTEQLKEEAALRWLEWATEHGDLCAIRQLTAERLDITGHTEPVAWFRAWMAASQQLLWEGDEETAWQVLRRLPSRDSLVRVTRLRTRDWRQRLQTTGAGNRSANLQWQQFHGNRLQRLEQQERWLESAGDLQEHLLMMRGQAAFSSGRQNEAAFLWRHLAQAPGSDQDLRKDAHFRWILALHALSSWTDLEHAVLSFRSQYPDSEKLPHILFTAADALRQQGHAEAALTMLGTLIQDHPSHDLLAYWEFSRGMIELNRGRWHNAVDYFQRSSRLPSSYQIAEAAQLWEALAWFEGEHAREALNLLNPLIEGLPQDHPQHAPALYHRARVQRAQDRGTNALADCRKFLRLHGDHPLAAETKVLTGELYLEAGNANLALQYFAEVPVARGLLYEHAAFQSARIHRARSDWPALRAHIEHYLQTAHRYGLGRRAEAVQQLVESLAFEGRFEAAQQLFERHWTVISQDPRSGDISELLLVGERLWRRVGAAEKTGFAQWLQDEKAQAVAGGEYLRAGRIVQHLAGREALDRNWQAGHPLLQQLLSFPRAELDARSVAWQMLANPQSTSAEDLLFLEDLLYCELSTSLAAGDIHYALAGLAAVAGDHTGQRYQLAKLARDFPGHPREPAARLQLARLYQHKGEYQQALTTLSAILSNRSARGRLHAEALALKAAIYQSQGESELALAHWQRLLAVHRAHNDIVAQAEQAIHSLMSPGKDNEV